MVVTELVSVFVKVGINTHSLRHVWLFRAEMIPIQPYVLRICFPKMPLFLSLSLSQPLMEKS